jgi:hypothetical protein
MTGELLSRLPSAQKTAKGAPAYSRYVNRRLGGYLAVAAFRLNRTPNQVSAVSALCTFAGIALIAALRPTVWTGIAVCVLLVLGYALDSADGQLARLRGGGSPAGEWLDHVIDAAKIAVLHLAVLIAGYRFSGLPRGWLLVPLGFSAVASIMFFTLIVNDLLRRAHRPDLVAAANSRRPSLIRSVLVVPTDYGLFCLSFLLWGAFGVYAVLYGLLFVANLGFLVLALRKWFHDMRELAGEGAA